jgi:hypothetical protein
LPIAVGIGAGLACQETTMDHKQEHDMADQVRLTRKFDDFAESLGGEGFPDNEITDCMMRSLCRRVGSGEELIARAKDIADMWFAEV